MYLSSVIEQELFCLPYVRKYFNLMFDKGDLRAYTYHSKAYLTYNILIYFRRKDEKEIMGDIFSGGHGIDGMR